MKLEEKIFFALCYNLRQKGIMPRAVVNMLNETIPHKRCWYYLKKWCDRGFYSYGVTLDLGWFEDNKMPQRYKDILNESR